jgi:hypothetical protein
MRGGSSVGQSRGLIILRSQVRVLPAPPIYLREPPLLVLARSCVVDEVEAALAEIRPLG